MRTLGLLLVVLGIAGLIAGGIDYSRSRRTVRAGPFSATIRERDPNWLPAVLGAVALAAGAGLVAASRRTRVG